MNNVINAVFVEEGIHELFCDLIGCIGNDLIDPLQATNKSQPRKRKYTQLIKPNNPLFRISINDEIGKRLSEIHT